MGVGELIGQCNLEFIGSHFLFLSGAPMRFDMARFAEILMKRLTEGELPDSSMYSIPSQLLSSALLGDLDN